MVLPLLVHGRSVGVLWVVATSEPGGQQLKAWVPLLEAFASYVGMALANAHLLESADLRRAAAEEASRGRTRAMSGLSHELRTPLHSILGYSELLLEGVGGVMDEKGERFVSAIRASALHQADLVDDILSLARPARPAHFSPGQVRVHEVVRECVVMVRERARASGVNIHVDVPQEAGMLTDRSKLSQVLINLVGNAVKFTDHGEVTVRVSQEGERLIFEVRDTGCGIAATELPHIFEPFWQGSASERRGEGTGLGLSLVQRLVGLLGGEVSVESQEQVGSTFRVHLPVVCPEQT
jgi:signal transduction histidine kinase